MDPKSKNILIRIKEIVKTVEPEAQVVLYGSRARGTETQESDWDILILTTQNSDFSRERIFRNQLFDLELEIEQPISVRLARKSSWEKESKLIPLYRNIHKEGVFA